MRGLLVLFACFKRPANVQFADGRELDGSFCGAFEVARSLTPLTCLSGGFQTRSAQTLLDNPESDLRNIGNVRECLTLRGGDESSEKGVEKEIKGLQKEIKSVKKEIKSVEKEIKSVENDIQVVEKEIKSVGQQDPRRHAELREDKEQLRKKEEQLRKKEEQLRKKEEQLRQLLLFREGSLQKSPLSGASIAWTESDAGLDRVGLCNDKKYFRVDTSYLMVIGDGNSRQERLLYCREAFLKQHTFLRERVLDRGALGWIMGSPGTGKTTATLSFLLMLDMNEWSVTFIRLNAVADGFCVQVAGSTRRTCVIERITAGKLVETLLREWSNGNRRFVVLDGFLGHQPNHWEAFDACRRWRDIDRSNRRLVVVTSMASRDKIYYHEDKLLQLEEHLVVSWTIDEYLQAVQSDEFYEEVESMLEMDLGLLDLSRLGIKKMQLGRSKEARVRQKHYLAGGSCRHMFEMSAYDVVKFIHQAFRSVPDLELIFRGNIGASSTQLVNRLIATFAIDGEVRWLPASEYISWKLMHEIEAEELKRVFSKYSISNAAVKGCLFEMIFFKEVQRGLRLTYRRSHNRPREARPWKGHSVVFFDPLQGNHSLPRTAVCFRPISELQGGYDALIVDKNAKKAVFVQVTVREKHALKLSFFLDALTALGIPPGRAWKVEIIFLIPNQRMPVFRISPVEDCGALEGYGWKKGEEKKKAKVAFPPLN
ncbi:hypothetical protein GUITHDRAFT_103565 [Guillardia theta CCMP2712]|uniref:Uncharacterized protein n=1 Tax=Guillardia theta (strain CCMP2712) TaxID=905079 RepID=L1JQZ1_GUITC|nr:hypothetical protein GUITHDRAFT_103565 [Guillardia theta CCMP2712]EKX50981.1 hypothetical protein GUITHDRAFT_103565 [Guillardia theta CCMP2712]|eukprot:XP_005837961.1 hypothetical protein GUITHDRAFT_103565 [Guillardia theta CCMP2712]